MKKHLLATAVVGSILVMAACTANWKVSASCDTDKKCQAGGEISGTLGGGGGSPQLRSSMLMATTIPDAAQFYIDTTGSTVAYPATGTVTISLINSSTKSVQAAKLFAWTRSGSIIRLTDPNAVNAWASVNGGSADKMTYQMTRFQADYGIGDQQIKVTSVYEGTATASATSSFYSCTPKGVHTRTICSGN